MPKAIVVDDSRTIRMILKRVLAEVGFDVCEAGNGREALEALHSEGGAVTLALVDWNMPEMNGIEFLVQLRRQPEFSSVKVIMVTTEAEVGHMSCALQAGADEVRYEAVHKRDSEGRSFNSQEHFRSRVARQSHDYPRTLQPGERIRVMIVDDSVVIRRIVAHVLQQDPAIEVVGYASNGLLGLQRIPQLNPDVLTLDIEMPDMDGLENAEAHTTGISVCASLMFSTQTERGAAITLEALTLRSGGSYVTKSFNEAYLAMSRSHD